jgi:GNAT superfamily N-acetyltransferase
LAGKVTTDPELIEVETSANLDRFIKFPYKLYKNDPHWVPPLLSERRVFFDKRKNPFYRAAQTKLFLARRDGDIVGRIASCINHSHNAFHEEQTGFFGFFDVIDDYSVAQMLLKVVLITLKAEGMDQMIGPANFSTNHEVGFQVDGDDSPPTIMMPYNRPYQVAFVERFGMTKVRDLLAYKMESTDRPTDRLVRIAEKIKGREGARIRCLNMRRFDEEVENINQVYNKAWARNWGFVPMSRDEFRHMAQDLKQIVDPDLVMIAEVNGNPVGFSLALPNINQALIHTNGRLFPFGLLKLLWHTKIRNTVNSIRILTMGIIPEYQKRGLDTVLMLETYNTGVGKGYKWGEMSWILDDNVLMQKAAEAAGGSLYKRYRMYRLRV